MEQQTLIDIYPAVGKSFEYYFNLNTLIKILLISGLIIGICVLALYFLYRYLKSPSQQALRMLQKLKKRGCQTELQAKEAVSSISGIIRSFLIQTYHIQSTGMTDAELVAFLQTKTQDAVTLKNAEELLLGTHHIRFSLKQVHMYDCEQLIQNARAFIKSFSVKK